MPRCDGRDVGRDGGRDGSGGGRLGIQRRLGGRGFGRGLNGQYETRSSSLGTSGYTVRCELAFLSWQS